jgi:hypothetical protein
MENMILLCIMIVVGYATCCACCTFSPGDDIQHGYCTFNTGQYGGAFYAINTGCHMDCKCKINSTTGVSYIPARGCLDSYPCYKSDGTLRNFSQEYVMENTIGNCFVYNDNDNCALSCRCKKGYVDYKDSDGTSIKCGTCSDCQCDVNLDNLTAVGNLTARPNQGIPAGNPCPYQCPDFTGRINLNNTIKCSIFNPSCDLTCQCRPGYGKADDIECQTCIDCSCPFNLTTGIAMDPLNDCLSQCPTFSDTYVSENVRQCRTKRKGSVYQCELECECKSPYFHDGNILCSKRPAKGKRKGLHPGDIAGICVGSIVGFIAFVALMVLCDRWA